MNKAVTIINMTEGKTVAEYPSIKEADKALASGVDGMLKGSVFAIATIHKMYKTQMTVTLQDVTAEVLHTDAKKVASSIETVVPPKPIKRVVEAQLKREAQEVAEVLGTEAVKVVEPVLSNDERTALIKAVNKDKEPSTNAKVKKRVAKAPVETIQVDSPVAEDVPVPAIEEPTPEVTEVDLLAEATSMEAETAEGLTTDDLSF